MRDPLQDPQPFDVVRVRQIHLHVLARNGQLLVRRWREAEPTEFLTYSIEEWRRAAVMYSPEVIQRAEDVMEGAR